MAPVLLNPSRFGAPLSSNYSPEVLADSPLVYYHLNETSGTTMTDSSGNGRDGTYNGSYTLGAPGLLPSGSDLAISLPTGNTTYGRTPVVSALQPSRISVEFWIKPASVSGTVEIAARAGSGAAFGSSYSWRIAQINQTLFFRVCVNGTSTTTSLTTGNVLSTSAATHSVATFDGTNMVWYVNGSPSATVARSGTLNSGGTTDLFVGRSADALSNGFNGVLDEFAMYGAALSSTRIAAHFAAA